MSVTGSEEGGLSPDSNENLWTMRDLAAERDAWKALAEARGALLSSHALVDQRLNALKAQDEALADLRRRDRMIGFRVKCRECGKVGGTRQPPGGDGTFLYPRRHRSLRPAETVPLADGSCPGSIQEGLWPSRDGGWE